MKVFYLCRTGRHTSLLAAALHIGIISEQEPWPSEKVKGFGDIKFEDIGKPYFVGLDSRGFAVYTLGAWKENMVITRAANDLIGMMGEMPGRWRIVDTTPFVSGWTKWGLRMKIRPVRWLGQVFVRIGGRKELKHLAGFLKEPANEYVH